MIFDCDLPITVQMLLFERSVDQINKSLFPFIVPSPVVAQLHFFYACILETIGHDTLSWEVSSYLVFNVICDPATFSQIFPPLLKPYMRFYLIQHVRHWSSVQIAISHQN